MDVELARKMYFASNKVLAYEKILKVLESVPSDDGWYINNHKYWHMIYPSINLDQEDYKFICSYFEGKYKNALKEMDGAGSELKNED